MYLCEQAAEKIIRAMLTAEGVHAGPRHGLRQLVEELVPDANPLKPPPGHIAVLEDYATAYRYPTPAGRVPAPPTSGKLNDLVNQVSSVLDETARWFGVDLLVNDTPAHHAKPVRA